MLYAVTPIVEWDINAINESTNRNCLAFGNLRPLAEVMFSSTVHV